MNTGDAVSASPMGAGTITGFSERGFPMVERVTVAWLRLEDGSLFDPYGVSDRPPHPDAATTGADAKEET